MSDKQPTIAFRAKNPAEVAAWRRREEAALEKFEDDLKAWGSERGVNASYSRNMLELRARGYRPATRDEPPLPGFRYDSQNNAMVPDRRTKTGKINAEELDRIKYKPTSAPGLTTMVFGAGYMGRFAIQNLGVHWYAILTIPLSEEDITPMRLNDAGNEIGDVDLDRWEQVNLSEYHAARERQGAAR